MAQNIKKYKKACIRKIPSCGPKSGDFTHPPFSSNCYIHFYKFSYVIGAPMCVSDTSASSLTMQTLSTNARNQGENLKVSEEAHNKCGLLILDAPEQ